MQALLVRSDERMEVIYFGLVHWRAIPSLKPDRIDADIAQRTTHYFRTTRTRACSASPAGSSIVR